MDSTELDDLAGVLSGNPGPKLSDLERSLLGWPDVPAGVPRPRPIYVDYRVDPYVLDEVSKRGWLVKDVRTIEDRAKSLEGVLEGVRLGSIVRDYRDVKFLETEARILGLVGSKDRKPDEKESETRRDVQSLLSMLGGKGESTTGDPEGNEFGIQAVELKKRLGRPKGSRNKKKTQGSAGRPPLGAALQSKLARLRREGKHQEVSDLLKRVEEYERSKAETT